MKNKSIDYYSLPLTQKEFEELSRDETLKKRIKYLKENNLLERRRYGQKPGQKKGSERSRHMYSSEQRTQALRMYHMIGSVTETVRRLGYPSREHLYIWIRNEGRSKQELAKLDLINILQLSNICDKKPSDNIIQRAYPSFINNACFCQGVKQIVH